MDVAQTDKPVETKISDKVHFEELTGLLEKIKKAQGIEKKKQNLRLFLDQWRQKHKELHKGKKTTDSFYPVMRLLLPHLENERVAYGIKEHTFAKLLIKVLCLGKNSPDASKLLNFNTKREANNDFASVAYYVLKNRCPKNGNLSISDVNKCLDDIAVSNTSKKHDVVHETMLHLLRNMTAIEQKWLIRMVMKELKVGLSQNSIFGVYHPDAEEMFNVNNNLEKVCLQLSDPNIRSHEIAISLFTPFSPMLGETAHPNKISEVLSGKPYLIETKFDGERIQLHKQNDDYSYFSRNGHNYSKTFGASAFQGTITQYIHESFLPGIHSCILDGEMLGYNSDTGEFGTKANHYDIKSADSGDYNPCFIVFDILLHNDKVLTNLPITERLPYIRETIAPISGRIQISHYKKGVSKADCIEALNKAIDDREEGIMIKDCESVYRPKARREGWFKVKPEYVDGLMDQLDLLIIGGYRGTGHRSGLMSHFLLALAKSPKDGEKPNIFHSFCKVGSGYTKNELTELNEKLYKHWKKSDENPPKSIVLAPGFKEKPSVWIEPSKSCIVQVKAAEIVSSDKFQTGCTLRFPRVEKIRDDKSWFECMTTRDLEDLKQKSGGKLSNKLDENVDDTTPVKKKRTVAPKVEKKGVMERFKPSDTSHVKMVHNIFDQKDICVANGPKLWDKAKLEKHVVQYGGQIVQNPDSQTYCVLADKKTYQVNHYIKSNIYNIINVSWFLDCIENKKLLPWTPKNIIHATKATIAKIREDFDEYGDNYTYHSTYQDLKDVFSTMQLPKCLSPEEIAEIEDEYFPMESPYGLFRLCKVYVDNKLDPNDDNYLQHSPLTLLAMEMRYFGATVLPVLDNSVSHLIMDKNHLERLDMFKYKRCQSEKKFHILNSEWVKECIREGCLCPEKLFLL
ncbi:DNA ligase 4 isoform X1 [Octopus sinensis]|uniref:DNA ligase n=1 Tax=Octopus sinensis TaxID=2607531 RepID=A0A6P7S553_9MOLL|nr:DNA ligase 4 isoform X1 [Octopus sinensis]XP_029633323.1 DNA ligase 4 isoform X1 [Octopus sinensis]